MGVDHDPSRKIWLPPECRLGLTHETRPVIGGKKQMLLLIGWDCKPHAVTGKDIHGMGLNQKDRS